MHDYDGGRRVKAYFMQDEWQPGLFYHVIGKAIPGETLFEGEEEMKEFIRTVLRFKLYHFFEILVYCLCGNHFHLVVRTRTPEGIRESLATKPKKVWSPSDELFDAGELGYTKFVTHSLSGALSGFARKRNNDSGHEGQLFIKPTLHGLTDKGAPGVEFSRRLYCYVGFNFAKHHMARADELYYGSSLTNPLYGVVDHTLVLELFGGAAAYKEFCGSYMRRFGRNFMAFNEALFYGALRPRYFDQVMRLWVEGEWRNFD